MPATLESIILEKDSSFYIGIFQDNLEKSTWHYHNSYEISFITEGSGRRIVADSIEEFHPGDLIFIGKKLPHVWIADKETRTPSGRTLETVYLQFSDDVLPSELLVLPEFKNVKRALKLAERGMKIIGDTLNEVSRIMLQLPYMKNFERVIHFYSIMDIIGQSNAIELLTSEEYLKKRFTTSSKRIAKIHSYLMNHYKEEIDLEKLSNLLNLAKGSLCRLFKTETGTTIFEYLNKIKVDYACNLLMDESLSIMDISFNSGFNNLSHFNKQFKKQTRLTPGEYRKRFRSLV
ncbi:AraC family transcriptional regulator [Prolixibacteraceae bacterium Z1-6]|uniref:AraC family transcriptional regulator n=1 Tax=Draconibacterium aestuarii TaxID=2998507 RepID=A0A9X3J8F9_9BACT|nr:AraC family transcriptional regulator [Prolixibacteraceae bacterium Z1-6]